MTRRTEKPRLEWKTIRGKLVPRHRVTWTEGAKRRERVITLDWKSDPAELDRLYWLCEHGEHPAQKPKAPAMCWRNLVVKWRRDPRVQRKLSDGTKKSYRRTMDALLEKNADKDVRETTRKHVRTIHDKLADTPRKADHMVQVIRLRNFVSGLPKRGAHLLAKNLTQPKGYDAVEKQFRAWREGLGERAKQFTLHGLRKLAIVQLAEAGYSDAEIQAVTNQSLEMVAYYRAKANRRVLSKAAQNRRDRNRNGT